MERVGGGEFVSGGWASRNNAQGGILWEIKGWIIYATRPGLFHFASRLTKSIKQTTVSLDCVIVVMISYSCICTNSIVIHSWVSCDHLFIIQYTTNIGMVLVQDNNVLTLLQVLGHPPCITWEIMRYFLCRIL